MFKQKFEEALNSHPLKSSSQKAVRAKVVELYPRIEPYIDEIWPKKA
jgi:PUA domain protein